MTDHQALNLRARMLGATLRMARLSSGRSIRETAALIGISPSALASYEAGRKSISLPELELLTFHLRISIRDFAPEALPSTAKGSLNPAAIVPLRQRMIAALLRTHRDNARLSIKHMASLVGITPSRLSGYERGDRPIPLPHLEDLAAALGHSIEDYFDDRGPIGEWHAIQRAMELLRDLPHELREFVVAPDNRPYLRLAKRLSELSTEKLRTLAKGLLDITQ